MLSILKRTSNATAAGALDEAATVHAARSRARHRLMGAVVLVGLGIVAFPLLFETQPRPIALDIPIELPPKRDTAAQPAPPPSAPAPRAPRVPAEVLTERAEAALPAPAAAPAAPPAETPLERPPVVAKPVPSDPPKAEPAAEAQRAQALLEGKDTALPSGAAASPASEPAASRFVVQAGAYVDAATLRDARQRVEKLGLKTYTQVVQTDAGQRTRVRVGPFATRSEAEQAAQRIKSSGLAASILTL